jgi:hypothetical protein
VLIEEALSEAEVVMRRRYVHRNTWTRKAG